MQHHTRGCCTSCVGATCGLHMLAPMPRVGRAAMGNEEGGDEGRLTLPLGFAERRRLRFGPTLLVNPGISFAFPA